MTINSTLSADNNELTITVQGRFDFSALQQFRNAYETKILCYRFERIRLFR
jgi:HptB-dependent secretion and biofilm anti anti-sigma factor